MRVEDGTVTDTANVIRDLMGDETWEEFKANILSKAGTCKTKQVAKVIQSEYSICILTEDAATHELHVLAGQVATHLQYSDFGSAECLRQAEQDQLHIAGCDSDFVEAFDERGHVEVKDMAFPNARHQCYDRIGDRKPAKVNRISNNCRIHRLQTVQAKVFDTVSQHVSGMVNIAIAMRVAGMHGKFLEILGGVIISRIEWCIGLQPPQPGTEERDYRDALAAYYFSDLKINHGLTAKDVKAQSSMKLQEDKAVWDKMMLSDPRKAHHRSVLLWKHDQANASSNLQIQSVTGSHAQCLASLRSTPMDWCQSDNATHWLALYVERLGFGSSHTLGATNSGVDRCQ